MHAGAGWLGQRFRPKGRSLRRAGCAAGTEMIHIYKPSGELVLAVEASQKPHGSIKKPKL